jgi:hypothetical protein
VLDLVRELLDDPAVSDPTHAAAVSRSGWRDVVDHTLVAVAPSSARTSIPANAPTLAPFVCGRSRRPLCS